MASPNNHITQFLAWFYRVKSPRYAVLLSGDWGVGKTHLIKSSFEGTDTKHLFISLYGVASPQQIDDEIFRQLHPILASKSARLAGNAIKSLLRLSIKLDSVTINPHASDVELPDFLRNTDGRVLVFDDLERAKMPVTDVLGHINQYVEHQDRHVVIICNELEIRPDELPRYQKTKEKVVGRSLRVVADVDRALPSFIEEISSTSGRELVRKNESDVRAVFEASKHGNLRHLRSALLEFDRLVTSLEHAQRQDERIGRDLLIVLLCLTFELRAQKIPDLRIQVLTEWNLTRDIPGNRPGPSPADVFFEKYSAHLPRDWLLSRDTWAACLESGRLDEGRIREEIRNCHYYASETTPDWIQFWHHYDLSDERFETLRGRLLPQFLGLKIDDIAQLAHLLGVFLRLHELGLCPDVSADQLLKQAKATIDLLSDANRIVPQKTAIAELFEQGSHGLGYSSRETSHFADFRRYADEALKRETRKQYPELAQKLLAQMQSDIRSFQRALTMTNSGENIFVEVPILAFCKPSDFIEMVSKASPEALRTIAWVMRERYRHSMFLVPLFDEVPWLKDVLPMIKGLAETRIGKRSKFHLDNIADSIQATLGAFAEVESARQRS